MDKTDSLARYAGKPRSHERGYVAAFIRRWICGEIIRDTHEISLQGGGVPSRRFAPWEGGLQDVLDRYWNETDSRYRLFKVL